MLFVLGCFVVLTGLGFDVCLLVGLCLVVSLDLGIMVELFVECCGLGVLLCFGCLT